MDETAGARPVGSGCEGCGLSASSRRDFIKGGARAATAALIVLGASPDALRALDVRIGSGRRGPSAMLSYPLPPADGATVDRDNQVILVRFSGSVHAFALSCPHQNTALRWLPKDSRFQCPKHKSRYRPDGTFIEGRATRSMDRFAVRQDASGIVVDVSTLYREDEDPAAWAAAVVHL